MIIFIISYQMYYTDFYYISSNKDIEHKVKGVYISELYWLSEKKKTFPNTLIVQINNTIIGIEPTPSWDFKREMTTETDAQVII